MVRDAGFEPALNLIPVFAVSDSKQTIYVINPTPLDPPKMHLKRPKMHRNEPFLTGNVAGNSGVLLPHL